MKRIKAVAPEARLTVVEHLDELRLRIVVSVAALAAAFGLCFWQNELLLELLVDPLPAGFEPTTLSPAEPFMTTVTVSLYGAFAIAAPVVLYQIWAFAGPALTRSERRVALPLLALVPLLFSAGVAFGYFIVLPAALKFLLHFNASQFDVQLRAREYFSFASLAVVLSGAVFQVPVVVLLLTRLGVVSVAQLRRQRRIAYVIIAVAAAILPGGDPVSMVMEMVPLVALYEASILMASLLERRRLAGAASRAS